MTRIAKLNPRHVVIDCHDPFHRHSNPRIEMWGVEYKGHWVEITHMDNVFNVRIDESPTMARFNLATREEAEKFVTQHLG